MAKYGLRPRTLKGELFTILSDQGSCGLKVSELAKTSQVWTCGNIFMSNTHTHTHTVSCLTGKHALQVILMIHYLYSSDCGT